ncbi:microtubule-associated serine/threonine-protein kinase 2-like [Phyllobates terribilis]|uniref:microtubule-associated serine/threonine-protein kinase 2-like n=1 Tax=Phyllobates terribilis TaxID=111132 RepID=UPI003CCAB396
MAELLLDNLQVEALWEILTTNRPEIVLLPPDGVLSFTHRLVMELVRDYLTKYHRGHLTSEYLTDLPQNIRTLLQQAEKRSQYGDLSFVKELAEKVLCVLEGPARSSERPETPEGDTEDEQNVTPETPDPNTSQPGPSSDLTTALFPSITCTARVMGSSSMCLLITPAGHIKVADFGISKVGVIIPETNTHKESLEDIAREFQDHEDCGTPLYMAPEIILKKGYGRPADWWSMGIILHEFLVGYVPFHADSLSELYKNIVTGDIIWDWDRAPPPDAQDLINDLLRTNPAQRLGTGGAFEIKSYPFLSNLNFANLLSQKPEYVPRLVSDVDTSLFINHAATDKPIVLEEEDTSEDNESLFFQNFTSSSERLSQLVYCAA